MGFTDGSETARTRCERRVTSSRECENGYQTPYGKRDPSMQRLLKLHIARTQVSWMSKQVQFKVITIATSYNVQREDQFYPLDESVRPVQRRAPQSCRKAVQRNSLRKVTSVDLPCKILEGTDDHDIRGEHRGVSIRSPTPQQISTVRFDTPDCTAKM